MQTFIYRFKEFRRRHRDKGESTSATPPPQRVQAKRKPPIEALMESPPVPPGEDDTSCKRHNQVLLAESKKAKPNMQVVNSLMERTYAFRRRDVMSSEADVTQLLAKYPFMQNADQVLIYCIVYLLCNFVIFLAVFS